MKYSLILASAGLAMPALAAAQAAENLPQGTSCAPCNSVGDVETRCNEKDPSKTDTFKQQASCLCGNEFFPQWRECRSCMLKEGTIPEADYQAYSAKFEVASKEFCGGNPTASWGPTWASATVAPNADAPQITGAAVVTPAAPADGAVATGATGAPGAAGAAPAGGAEAAANADANAAARVAGDGSYAEAGAKADSWASANGNGAAEAGANANAWASANGNGAAEAGANAGAKAGANGVETWATASTSVAVPGVAGATDAAVPAATTSVGGSLGKPSVTGSSRNSTDSPIGFSGASAGKVVSGLAVAVAGAVAVMVL